jgi:hypothetical protein
VDGKRGQASCEHIKVLGNRIAVDEYKHIALGITSPLIAAFCNGLSSGLFVEHNNICMLPGYIQRGVGAAAIAYDKLGIMQHSPFAAKHLKSVL